MSNERGFTLIELMIVVLVISILAAIAIPNYLEQARKGRRSDAARAMGEYQLALERWRAENPSYANCSGSGCGSGTYPAAPTSEFYEIPSGGFTTAASSYSITFQPKGKQAGDPCGNLIGNNTDKQKPQWSTASCNN